MVCFLGTFHHTLWNFSKSFTPKVLVRNFSSSYWANYELNPKPPYFWPSFGYRFPDPIHHHLGEFPMAESTFKAACFFPHLHKKSVVEISTRKNPILRKPPHLRVAWNTGGWKKHHLPLKWWLGTMVMHLMGSIESVQKFTLTKQTTETKSKFS